MNLLVAGDGAREDALAWRWRGRGEVAALRRSPFRWGARFAEETEAFVWARAHGAVLVAGSETLLAGGIVDRARAAGVAAVGPTAAGACLEASKNFGRDVARAAGIPVPAPCDSAGPVYPRVYKSDGLAAGKGVAVVGDAAEEPRARARLARFGFSIHSEEYLPGDEFSAFVGLPRGGGRPVWLGSARDQKRLSRAPDAPMTGGMGAVAPHPRDEEIRPIATAWAEAARAEMYRRGVSYDGVLYLGGAWTARGPILYEFNVRLGDPETQAMIFLWTPESLAAAIAGLARGASDDPVPSNRSAVAVVFASPGYPARSVEAPPPRVGAGFVVFHGLPRGRVATVVRDTGTKVPTRAFCALLYQDLGTVESYYYRDDIGFER